ncbi:uncharacterized protein A4U43_C01F20030 [Asparagus officinalis]|uniref:ATP-grasp fold succinyl-CoA synthetase-type domain-containing protein n=1 Tax=Asparagus officinalis TaxID=4686 RepID=A0A5P1FQR5_ASPOF|nr:uncharacterized protein A4U43_C01F20030 [Asparagus officinalis]
MVRGLLGNLASRSLSIVGKLRRLNIYEYQSSDLMSKHGINVPRGVAVSSTEEVRKAIKDVFPGEKEIVVNSQILAGGRGLGTFKSRLKGGVHIVKTEEVEDIAGLIAQIPDRIILFHLLAGSVIGPGGFNFVKEMYREGVEEASAVS